MVKSVISPLFDSFDRTCTAIRTALPNMVTFRSTSSGMCRTFSVTEYDPIGTAVTSVLGTCIKDIPLLGNGLDDTDEYNLFAVNCMWSPAGVDATKQNGGFFIASDEIT
mmetsp:Transcript_24650/g.40804  ORF Transcript_24650/g.40804 Transcript_24650/m.40804 type:complete len:109 (-) Transcript_24650:562-888(-)